jgi:hypothetical protein
MRHRRATGGQRLLIGLSLWLRTLVPVELAFTGLLVVHPAHKFSLGRRHTWCIA